MKTAVTVLVTGASIAVLVLLCRWAPQPVYVLAAVLLLLSAALVMHAVGLDPRRLSVPAVWYLSYVGGTAIPAMIVATGEHTPYVAPYLFAVLVTLVTAPAGMLMVKAVTGFERAETQAFFKAPLQQRNPTASEVSAYVVFLLVCLALTGGYVIETPVIPLLYLIQHPGSAAELVGMREESFKLLDSPFLYAYDVLQNVLYPFLIMVALGYYLVSRRLGWLVLLLVTAIIGLLYAAASVAKSPVAAIVLVSALFIYLYQGGQVRLRVVVGGFMAVFIFPVAVLVRSLSGLGFGASAIALAILRRLFYAPALVLYHYFVVVPDVVPYLHGRTIGRVQWILGGERINIGNFVFRHMFPTGIETGIANTSFLGYLHADFGVAGVLIGGIFVGALVQGLQVWLTRRRKTVVALAAYAFMLWAAWKINFQSLPLTLLSGGIIVVIVLLELLRLTASFFGAATARLSDEAVP